MSLAESTSYCLRHSWMWTYPTSSGFSLCLSIWGSWNHNRPVWDSWSQGCHSNESRRSTLSLLPFPLFQWPTGAFHWLTLESGTCSCAAQSRADQETKGVGMRANKQPQARIPFSKSHSSKWWSLALNPQLGLWILPLHAARRHENTFQPEASEWAKASWETLEGVWK